MSTNIDHITDSIKTAGLEPTAVLTDKVKETLRKMQNKLLPGALSKAEPSRTWLAIEISCRLTNTVFERGQLLRHCCVGEADYQKALNTCKALLGISSTFKNVADILSMQYSQALMEESKPILARYEICCVRNLPAEMKRYVDITSPLYVCASFYVAALVKKIKINKAALSTLAETPLPQFIKLVDAMLEVTKNKGNRSSAGPLANSTSISHEHSTMQSASAGISSADVAASSIATASSSGTNANSSSSSSSLASMRQALALRNSNAQNIAPQTSASGNANGAVVGCNSSGVKRKCVPSLLERLHSRADVENLILSPTEGRSSLTIAPPVSLGERLADVQAREEAERAEVAQRAAREAFESWRDAKIAEKRAKITR